MNDENCAMGSKLVYYMHRIYKTNCVIILLHRSYRTYMGRYYFALNLKDYLDRYFVAGAKQIMDKIQLENPIFSLKKHQVLSGCYE